MAYWRAWQRQADTRRCNVDEENRHRRAGATPRLQMLAWRLSRHCIATRAVFVASPVFARMRVVIHRVKGRRFQIAIGQRDDLASTARLCAKIILCVDLGAADSKARVGASRSFCRSRPGGRAAPAVGFGRATSCARLKVRRGACDCIWRTCFPIALVFENEFPGRCNEFVMVRRNT
jgi:hypothetical protein